jgi:hypothetical protein
MAQKVPFGNQQGVIVVIEKQLRKNVDEQIALLNDGKPLEAFDKYFAAEGVMFANGEIFATNAAEGRSKQEPFITSATSICGKIVDLIVLEEKGVCVFRNRSSFVDSGGKKHQIDGVCWQRWLEGKIVEERYFYGGEMQKMLSMGILTSPEKVK